MKTLVTNNGNLLVKKEENLFGFFNKEGKLLREATAQEFSWAENKMPEYSGPEIIFDFSSLEEKIKLVKKEAMSKLVSFTGMSEETIKRFLDYFKGSPEELKISGQISYDWSISACSTGGCMYSDSNWNTMWAVFSNGTVKHVDSIIMEFSAAQNANGSWSDADGYTAEYIYEKEPEADFFILNHGYRYSCDGRETSEENLWEIFKAPNMAPVLEARQEEAVSKVKDFLLGFKNKLDPQKIYEEIKNKVGVSDLDLLNSSIMEIEPGWVTEGVSTSGCAYHDSCSINVWAIFADGQVFKVDSKTITENAGQNANGSWSDSYGYTFKYLMKQAPGALFFILNEIHDRQADRQPSVYENTWSILRSLTRKEIMINKINSNNRPTTFADLFKK